jgi:hypothetical protein
VRSTQLETLSCFAALGVATVKQIAERLDLPLSSARNRVAILRKVKLIRELETMASGAVPYELSAAGRRALPARFVLRNEDAAHPDGLPRYFAGSTGIGPRFALRDQAHFFDSRAEAGGAIAGHWGMGGCEVEEVR